MTKLFIMSDIHGCAEEFEELLAIVDPVALATENAEFVFCGDYVDRGPNTKGVIDILINRRDNHEKKHTFILGNHEQMILDLQPYDHNIIKSYGHDNLIPDDIDNMWRGRDLDFMKYMPPSHVEFMKSLHLGYKKDRVLCVHAGIDPEVNLRGQDPQTMIWTRNWDFYEGEYPEDVFVVRGHTPQRNGPKILPNQLNIDTGCVFGGQLTCAVVDSLSGNIDNFYQVQSKKNYTRSW